MKLQVVKWCPKGLANENPGYDIFQPLQYLSDSVKNGASKTKARHEGRESFRTILFRHREAA